MVTHSTSRPGSRIEQAVLRVISTRKAIQPGRLQAATNLSDELGFDDVDVVDIILAVEKRFHVIIPDEVPLHTANDFVRWVAQHLPRQRASTVAVA